MRVFILTVLSALALVQCQDYSCPKGKSKTKKIVLSPGDSFSYNTNFDDKYYPKTKCPVVYKANKKCKAGIRFSCDSFDLPNRDSKKCRKGDKLILGKKAYCGSTAPDAVTLTGKAARKGLRVLFASDKKNVGTGAQCTAVCLDGAATTTTAAPTTAAPTTTSGTDDAVTTRVKGYIDAGTCNSVSFSDFSTSVCGDSATSYYKEFEYNGKRVIISNNIPDHAAENDQLTSNPNLRCPGWQYIAMPLNPAKGSTMTDTRLGTVGLAVTGGAFFNDLSNPDGSLALTNEGPSLDSCLGHSAPTSMPGGGGMGPPSGRYKRQANNAGQYHYHGNINCTDAGAATGANDPDTCKLIGYYRDGVPVYGFCKDSSSFTFTSCYKLNSGATTSTVVTVSGTYTVASSNSDYTFSADSNCNLDEANGAIHPTTGEYSYFMTTGYPWTPIKFAGDQGQSNYCSAD